MPARKSSIFPRIMPPFDQDFFFSYLWDIFCDLVNFKANVLHPNTTLLGPGRGLTGPDDQTHSCQSETTYSMMPKLGDFYFLFLRHVLAKF